MKAIVRLAKNQVFLLHNMKYSLNHIKNMANQNLRVQLLNIENQPMVVQNKKVYKPTYTIEFNRQGQVLLYSANPINKQTLYFRYPYVLYESFIPISILVYLLNPLNMVWYWPSFFFYFSTALTIPRIWHFHTFKFTPQKLFLLRGGRVLKVQAQSAGGQKWIYWVENWTLKHLTQDNLRFDGDEADILTQQGQLRYNLTVQSEQMKVWGINTNNELLYFKQYGTVHHPELFEAAVKGYNIDTTDFVINTADNVRVRQGNHNH